MGPTGKERRYIRVIDAPRGEAPIHIRKQLIGLVLPLPPGSPAEPRDIEFSTGYLPPHPWLFKLKLLFGIKIDHLVWKGYRVDPVEAIAIIEATGRTEAAAWWRKRFPNQYAEMIFNAECCEIVEKDKN
ncbi:MAG: hypothetical protein LBR29_02545 [Methylobacteriaceae bacterium]|jgi:hypothetical protein|nr:hypothetical protein [Methylobacteriaceae bacterium]